MAAKILLVEDNEMQTEARREGERPSDRGAGGAQPRPSRDGGALALPASVKQCDLRHGIVAEVPRGEGGPFQSRRCGDQAVRQLQRAASVTPFEASSQLGDGSGDGEDDEAVEQRACRFALARAHSCVDLCHRDCRAARDRLPRRGEEKLACRRTPAQEVNEDVRVEQKLAHPWSAGAGAATGGDAGRTLASPGRARGAWTPSKRRSYPLDGPAEPKARQFAPQRLPDHPALLAPRNGATQLVEQILG